MKHTNTDREVFTEHFDSFDRARSFKTWIFATAHNHLINFYSSNKKTVPLDDVIRTLKHDHAFSESIDKETVITKLMKKVDSLPQSERELVVMRYVNDLTHTKIAHILGENEGAIRTALSRALARIRDQYN